MSTSRVERTVQVDDASREVKVTVDVNVNVIERPLHMQSAPNTPRKGYPGVVEPPNPNDLFERTHEIFLKRCTYWGIEKKCPISGMKVRSQCKKSVNGEIRYPWRCMDHVNWTFTEAQLRLKVCKCHACHNAGS